MSAETKILYLVRHAKSSWKDQSLADRDRPLNKRGERASPDMGQRMAAQGHKPDLIISSPANRAISTARNIARELGIEEFDIITEDDLYFSGAGGMLRVLERLNNRYNKVMMVGHNPTITHVMNILGNTNIWNMPTCAIAVIGFDITFWADLNEAEGELLGYDYPKGPGSFTP